MLVCFFEDSIDATSAPESEDVTKKVTIRTSEKIEAILEIGYASNNANKATL